MEPGMMMNDDKSHKPVVVSSSPREDSPCPCAEVCFPNTLLLCLTSFTRVFLVLTKQTPDTPRCPHTHPCPPGRWGSHGAPIARGAQGPVLPLPGTRLMCINM